MSGADSFMPLWIADYLADTTHLTTVQHGAYILLLMAYWRRQGPMPADDEQLRSITRLSPAEWRKMKPTLASFFTEADGLWRQGRADHELAKASAKMAAKSQAGSIGAQNRWQRDSKRIAGASPSHRQTDASSPSPPLGTEQQDAASPTAPSAAPGPLDLQKSLFSTGVKYLSSNGKSDGHARSIIGKWRKDYDDVTIIGALAKAEAEGSPDPVAFITKCLNGKGKANGSRQFGRNHGPLGIFTEAYQDLATASGAARGKGFSEDDH